MNIIFADFNAMTEAGSVCLTTQGSSRDIERDGLKPGDWAWLSDGDLLVGARLDDDPYHGLVGRPRWETLVHFDDEDASDFHRVWNEFQTLLQSSTRSVEDEVRLFQLLAQFDRFAPEAQKIEPGQLAFRRAAALYGCHQFELALIEIDEARKARPNSTIQDFLLLEILRRTSFDRAVREAEALASSETATAPLLAAVINILAIQAETLPGDEFPAFGKHILGLCDRFDRAPGRNLIPASLLSLVQFNRGMLLLQLERTGEAKQALELAKRIAPLDHYFDEATQLVKHDEYARRIAEKVRSKPLVPAA
jgi:hypothetical protein